MIRSLLGLRRSNRPRPVAPNRSQPTTVVLYTNLDRALRIRESPVP